MTQTTKPHLLRRRFIAASLGAACLPLLLNACTKAAEAEAAAPWRDGGVIDAANALAQVAGVAKGISVGSEKASRTVHVIFDPRCSHCAKLWIAAAPIAKEGSHRFVWVPVGLTSKESVILAAAIWESPHPVAAMAANELSVAQKTGGMKLAGLPSEAAMQVIKDNGRLAEMIGLQEVPITMVKDSRGRAIVTAGSMETARLREFLAR